MQDLYQAVGGRDTCIQLAEAFYSRVKRDPALRPLFPSKSMRCAIEAFSAFLAQFLGGPAEDSQMRWFLSLRESHSRFAIGSREREAWMRTMREALDDVPMDASARAALADLFEHSSAYIANTKQPSARKSGDRVQREMSQRWTEQLALDDLVLAVRLGDATRALELIESPALQCKFARDRAVFAHALSLMMRGPLQQYVERELQRDPALAQIHHRYGRTLLHDAAAQGNLRIVELLLRLGADANAETGGGQDPLDSVANQCHGATGGDIVRALVRAGAQVDARSTSQKTTALHTAARRGNTVVAEALLKCGADSNARDKSGATPLQRAKNCRKAEVASLLLSCSASPRNRIKPRSRIQESYG